MKILAIETSCDETAMAVVEAGGGLEKPRFEVSKNVTATQIDAHRPYGGVFPTLAKRSHEKNLPVVLEKMELSDEEVKGVDVMAVTIGPGLEPALWRGIEFAKDLAEKFGKPLLGVNHLEGHLYSPLLSLGEKDENVPLPAIGLVVSGGHTILLVLTEIYEWDKIGETRDDAAGEAYDKVARLLGMPYPGGPEISRAAEEGNPQSFEFPRPMINNKDYDFSFSGLKTAVLYEIRSMSDRDDLTMGQYKSVPELPKSTVADMSASFQQAVVDVLVKKTTNAAVAYGAKSILLGGGVAANKVLRDTLEKEAKRLDKEFYVSEFEYSGDNAAMIAAAAYINSLRDKDYPITAQANLNL